MQKPVTKVIFPVAGLGTRFLPATKAIPKEMLPIADRPLIQYAVEEAREAGVTDFIFVTNPRNEKILQAHFADNEELEAFLAERGKTAELRAVATTVIEQSRLKFCHQDAPLGLGHAVWCAREFIKDEPFAVILPDDLIMAPPGCLKQMIDVHARIGGNIAAVEDVPRELTYRYGILDVSHDDGKLASARGLVEKPDPEKAPSTLSIIGRYVLDQSVFEHLDKMQAGAGGEIQLTDAIAASMKTVPFHGLRFEGERFDCGSMAGFVEANAAFGLRLSLHAEYLRERLSRHL
ncbi:MAG: UTP--glucose-1-phosphate uridylyltransferase [Alphaproteobacteria bacterium]|nr:UTP--glucose-1-phosphate uridylyltransferase [Alphaproteobacteria bacterium]